MTCYNCNYGEAKYELNHMKLCARCLVKRTLSKPETPLIMVEPEKYYLEGYGIFDKGELTDEFIANIIIQNGFGEKL